MYICPLCCAGPHFPICCSEKAALEARNERFCTTAAAVGQAPSISRRSWLSFVPLDVRCSHLGTSCSNSARHTEDRLVKLAFCYSARYVPNATSLIRTVPHGPVPLRHVCSSSLSLVLSLRLYSPPLEESVRNTRFYILHAVLAPKRASKPRNQR